MQYDTFITDFMTLLVTIEPIGVIPVYLALTGGMNAVERHHVALMCCVIATAFWNASSPYSRWVVLVP